MRHGQSEHNTLDVYNSNPDSSHYKVSHLTQEGEAQALQTAQDLLKQGFNRETISAVYVSPLPRTRETALILAKAGVISEEMIVIDERLIEIQVGDLEGKTTVRPWNDALSEHYHSETLEQIFHRVSAFATEHLSAKTDQNILVVTHGYPALALIKFYTGEQPAHFKTGQAIVVGLPTPQS
jgi:broad specificity phosphatase PhoE